MTRLLTATFVSLILLPYANATFADDAQPRRISLWNSRAPIDGGVDELVAVAIRHQWHEQLPGQH